MTKVISALLTIVLLLALVACSNGNEPTPTIGDSAPQATENNNSVATTEPTQTELPEDWGIEDKCNTMKDGNLAKVHFSWPRVEGITAGSGRATGQGDGTWVMVDAYAIGVSPENIALKDFYPAYLQQTQDNLQSYYGVQYKNGVLSVGEGVISTIGEYEVCKYSGKHTYEFDGKAYEHPCVVYATTIKGNGAIIYWLVQDVTEDHSAGKKVEDNANKIILSIWEE